MIISAQKEVINGNWKVFYEKKYSYLEGKSTTVIHLVSYILQVFFSAK